MSFADIVTERSGLILSSEAETCCGKIDKVHPDLLAHIAAAEECIAEENKRINSWTASQFRGTMRGCLWFRDPVTSELLLGGDRSWILNAMDENIWLPISLAFPALTPYILTGPVTDIYALHLEDIVHEGALESALKMLGIDINEHCRIRKSTEMWIVFSGTGKRMPCRMGHPLILEKRPIEGVKVISAGGIMPIPNTAEWRRPPEYVTQLRSGADFVELRPVPEQLLSQFFIKNRPSRTLSVAPEDDAFPSV